MNRAVVIGANGVVGGAVVDRLMSRPDWHVTTVGRSAQWIADGSAGPTPEHVSVDLLDGRACRSALSDLDRATHVIYAARVTEGVRDDVASNVRAFTNALTPLVETAPALRRIVVVHGSKWYGSHLGPFRIPAKEHHRHHDPGVFYFAQHEWLCRNSAQAGWSYATVRPHILLSGTPRSATSLCRAIAAYLHVRSLLGEPLSFPGTRGAFGALQLATDDDLLASAIVWLAESEAGVDADFNINNGDNYRWSEVWSRLTGLEADAGETVAPIRLESTMPVALDVLARDSRISPADRWLYGIDWNWVDFVLRSEWDAVVSGVKAWTAGFDSFSDSEDSVVRHVRSFGDLR